jgi:hypothetical protein
MSKILMNKSETMQDRIDNIKLSLKAHRKNIQLLRDFYLGIKKLECDNGQPRVITHFGIPKCEKRYRSTLQNLTTQITMLEHELTILKKYVA